MRQGRFYNDTTTEFKLFRLAAPHYEQAQTSIADALVRNFRHSALTELDILELGCGTGITSEVILQADDRIKLIALDNEEKMIPQARKALSRFVKQDRVKIILSDALDFVRRQPNNRFDAVCTALTLHNCPRKYRESIYPEIHRILKDGGSFITLDKVAQDDTVEHQKELDWQVKQFSVFVKMGRSDLQKKWEDHYAYDEQPDLLLSEQELISGLRKAGFRDISKVFRQHMEAAFVAVK